MLLTSTLGERLVSKATADTLGTVDGAVIDAERRVIAALSTGTGRKSRVVPWSAITGVGDAAVIVDVDDALRDPNDGAEVDQARGDTSVLGGLLLSDLGNEYGTVADLRYDEATGEIQSILTSKSTEIAAERLRSIGSYAWIIAAADDEQ